MRSDDVCLRRSPAQLGGDGALVRRVAEREEQADGDRLGVHLGQRREVERPDDAVRADPLAHAVTSFDRDERLRMPRLGSVEVGTVLTPQVEQVLEALGRHERGPRSLALEQRVGRDRRSVAELLDADVDRPDRGRHLDDRPLLRAGAGRHLRGTDPVAREEHRIRERAPDVDAEDRHGETLAPIFQQARLVHPAARLGQGFRAGGLSPGHDRREKIPKPREARLGRLGVLVDQLLQRRARRRRRRRAARGSGRRRVRGSSSTSADRVDVLVVEPPHLLLELRAAGVPSIAIRNWKAALSGSSAMRLGRSRAEVGERVARILEPARRSIACRVAQTSASWTISSREAKW